MTTHLQRCDGLRRRKVMTDAVLFLVVTKAQIAAALGLPNGAIDTKQNYKNLAIMPANHLGMILAHAMPCLDVLSLLAIGGENWLEARAKTRSAITRSKQTSGALAEQLEMRWRSRLLCLIKEGHGT